jgi:hypothetical protein
MWNGMLSSSFFLLRSLFDGTFSHLSTRLHGSRSTLGRNLHFPIRCPQTLTCRDGSFRIGRPRQTWRWCRFPRTVGVDARGLGRHGRDRFLRGKVSVAVRRCRRFGRGRSGREGLGRRRPRHGPFLCSVRGPLDALGCWGERGRRLLLHCSTAGDRTVRCHGVLDAVSISIDVVPHPSDGT